MNPGYVCYHVLRGEQPRLGNRNVILSGPAGEKRDSEKRQNDDNKNEGQKTGHTNSAHSTTGKTQTSVLGTFAGRRKQRKTPTERFPWIPGEGKTRVCDEY